MGSRSVRSGGGIAILLLHSGCPTLEGTGSAIGRVHPESTAAETSAHGRSRGNHRSADEADGLVIAKPDCHANPLQSCVEAFLMSISQALLPEFDHEVATTRNLLDRLPQ